RISQKQNEECRGRQHEPQAEPVLVDLEAVPCRHLAEFPRRSALGLQRNGHERNRSKKETGGRSNPPAGIVVSTIDTLKLTLRNRDRALYVLAACAVVREHVEDDEVGNRRRRLLADRTEAARRERTLGDVAIRRVLRIRGPDRILVVGVEAVREVALRRLDPWVEVVRLE